MVMPSWVFNYFKVYELLIPTNHTGLKGLTTRPAKRLTDWKDVRLQRARHWDPTARYLGRSVT